MNDQPATNGAAEPARQHSRIKVVLAVLKDLHTEGGAYANDILDGVHAAGQPEVTIKILHSSLLHYVQSGYIARPTRGRYALTAAGERLLARDLPPPTPRRKYKAKAKPTPIQLSDMEEVAAFRTALDHFEKVVRRHAKIAAALAQSDAP